MNTVFIYGLNCPTTGRTRYIGKSIDPFDRLHGCGGHLSYAKGGEDTHKAKWIRTLLTKKQEPVIEILDEVPAQEWPIWEREWIRLYRALGFRLTNATEGGEGISSMLDEVRAKISKTKTGTKHSFETRAKMSAARSGIPWSAGRTHSPEALEKNRVAHLGRRRSEEESKAQSLLQLSMKRADNVSGHVGVFWDKSREKWVATINLFSKTIYRKRFKNLEDAIFARNLVIALEVS